jgi:hypothetical protein
MMHAGNGCLLVLLVLLAACGREAAEEAPTTAAREPIAVAPPIVTPDEAVDRAQPPSYEVGIASAAADRNNALARCAKQPEAVRTQCEQEANAAFAEADQSLQDLRGNQQ